MPNGTQGDHPVTDILIHGVPVFSAEADALVRDIRRFVSQDEMYGLVDWFHPPPIPELEQQLAEIRDRLRARAKASGWEVDPANDWTSRTSTQAARWLGACGLIVASLYCARLALYQTVLARWVSISSDIPKPDPSVHVVQASRFTWLAVALLFAAVGLVWVLRKKKPALAANLTPRG